MLVGCAQWAVTLGRFDVQYATNTMARYASCPREGHMQRLLHSFGYMKSHNRVRIKIDPSDPVYDDFEFVENIWTGLYKDAIELLDPRNPKALNNLELLITIMVDASHASCLVTRRSVTGIIVFVGQTPVAWYSKRQNTVESSTYSSELVAFRIAVEKAIAIRSTLRALGMNVTKPAVLLCDSSSVCTTMQNPSCTLKKKHQAVNWHIGREAQAMGLTKVAHCPGEWNISDILTKPLGPQRTYKLLKRPLYGKFD